MLTLALLAQIPIAYYCFVARTAASMHWSETLGGAGLPDAANVSLSCILFTPLATALCLIVGYIAGRKRQNESIILWSLFLTIIAEACLLSYLSYGLVSPALNITYRLS